MPTLQFIERLLTPILSVLVALVLMGIILSAVGANPFRALGAIMNGAFGSSTNIGTMLAKTCPLLITGAGIAFALNARLYNVGAEGQIYVGGLVATWFILTFSLSGFAG